MVYSLVRQISFPIHLISVVHCCTLVLIEDKFKYDSMPVIFESITL